MATQLQAPISLSFAIGRSATALMSSINDLDRAAGRALQHAEGLGVSRGSADRAPGRQGVVLRLGCSVASDLSVLQNNEERVAESLSRSLGMWPGAAQATFELLDPLEWANAVNVPGAVGGRRLDRYLTDDVAVSASGIRHEYLVTKGSISRIILRRLRYRPTYDFAPDSPMLNLAVWSTPTTHLWAQAAQPSYLPYGQDLVKYLPFYLLGESSELTPMSVDVACSSPDDWGSVDTESDPLRVLEVTTRTGVTSQDVASVFAPAAGQVVTTAEHVGTSSRANPIAVFIEKIEHLAEDASWASDIDIVLIHRGGGLVSDGVPKYSLDDQEALTVGCERLRDLGIEVVVAIGHGDTALLAERSKGGGVGIFEASTPTAGAAWIVKEHINAGLIPDDFIYSQRRDTNLATTGEDEV